MAKYAVFFSYTSDTWTRMVKEPGNRSAAAQHLTQAAGGTLECLYWMLGEHDGIAIIDVPDTVSAAAVSVAVTSSGAFKHSQTHALLTQDDLEQTLERAGTLAADFQPPGRG